MKLVKKIAFVSVFAVLVCGSIFAKGNKDSEETVSETTEEPTVPIMTDDPGFQK